MYLRVYNSYPNTSLSLLFYIESLEVYKFDISYNTFYDESIKPQEPNFIYGERRWYSNASNPNVTTFNYLYSVENCSPLVEECILNDIQSKYLTPKSIKISKKYSSIKIITSYDQHGAVLDFGSYFEVSQPMITFIQTNSLSAWYPQSGFGYIGALTSVVPNGNKAFGTSVSHSENIESTYARGEAKLVYDESDYFYHYMHIENPTNAIIDDNIIEIIGVNSRKKTSRNIIKSPQFKEVA